MTTVPPPVLVERRGEVAVVSLNRPERRNGWTDEMSARFAGELRRCDADPTVRAVVVTGTGPHFCVGADVDTLDEFRDKGTLDLDGVARTDQFATTGLGVPVVAALRGGCAGIGLVQALVCDVRFAAPDVRISTAFAKRGLAAEQGVSWLLPRIVGVAAALDLLLSARTVGAAEALRLGLLNRVCDDEDVLDAAVAYATDLATWCSPASMATIKAQVWGDLTSAPEPAIRRADALAERFIAGADFAEGLDSFVQKRRPHFPPWPAGGG